LLHGFIFKLEEEEKPALLLHLLAFYAERCVFGSASGCGCLLVVADSQAAKAGNNAFSLAQVLN
jgi:hypothetical protein